MRAESLKWPLIGLLMLICARPSHATGMYYDSGHQFMNVVSDMYEPYPGGTYHFQQPPGICGCGQCVVPFEGHHYYYHWSDWGPPFSATERWSEEYWTPSNFTIVYNLASAFISDANPFVDSFLEPPQYENPYYNTVDGPMGYQVQVETALQDNNLSGASDDDPLLAQFFCEP